VIRTGPATYRNGTVFLRKTWRYCFERLRKCRYGRMACCTIRSHFQPCSWFTKLLRVVKSTDRNNYFSIYNTCANNVRYIQVLVLNYATYCTCLCIDYSLIVFHFVVLFFLRFARIFIRLIVFE